jgi:hypothetical protein
VSFGPYEVAAGVLCRRSEGSAAVTGKQRHVATAGRRVAELGDDLPPGQAAITDLLTQGVPLEVVQYLAGHAEPRTTGLYDRR